MSNHEESCFPEQEYVSDNEKLEVADFYGLGQINSWVKNSRGLVNPVYELDECFFLTLHHQRTKNETEAMAEIAHSVDPSIPLIRPVRGTASFVVELAVGPALLTRRVPGTHYVGVAHTDKLPIAEELHPALAACFWRLQAGLSGVTDKLKNELPSEHVTNIGQLPTELPAVAEPLSKYAPEDGIPDFKYPDLIHDDMERQNILIANNKVSGIVDLDSLRAGDVLYEYGHFLFNIVLCDPEADLSTIDLYINHLLDAAIIEQGDVETLYGHIYEFCISDIIEFHKLMANPTFGQHTLIDMELLVQQYEKALILARQFFGIKPS